MDKIVVVQRKQKRSSSREREFCKRDRNDTSSCSESASQVFNSENDIGNFVGIPLADADRRKVLFHPFSPTKAPNLSELCNPITRQAIELESYPNHPRIQQVL